MRMVIDEKDNLAIPHMDKQLAINIKNLEEETLRFALMDLIEPYFIEAAVKRLKKLKTAINKEEQKKDSKVFLNDDQWSMDTHQEQMEKSGYYKENKERQEKNISIHDENALWQRRFAWDYQQGYEYEQNSTYYSDLMWRAMGYKGGSGKFLTKEEAEAEKKVYLKNKKENIIDFKCIPSYNSKI